MRELKALLKDVNSISSAAGSGDAISAIQTEAQASIAPMRELKSVFRDLAAEIQKTAKLKPDIVNDSEVAKATTQLKVLKNEMRETAQQTENLVSKVKGVSSVLTSAALPLAGLSAGLTLLFANASRDFGQFEKSLKTIQAVSSATLDEIQAIRQASFELGQQTVFSNQQVVDSFVELARAGFTARESLEAMPKLLQLAAAAGGDLETASAIVGSNLKAFGLQVQDTGRLVDNIAQGANRSAASIEDLGFAFKQVAPLAAQTGQSVEDVSALLSILANNAVKGADAGSDLRNIISRLLNPSKQTAEAMEKLGISLKNQNGTVKPLVQLFEELNGKFANLSDSSKAQAAAILAGEENLKSFLILAGTAPDQIESMRFAMEHSTGAAELMAHTMQDGLVNATEQFQGSAETLSTQLGEDLAPAFSLVLKNATALINVLIQNRGITTFAAGAGLAAASIIGLGTAAAGAVALFGPLVTALGAAGIGLAGLAPVAIAATVAIVGAGGLAVALSSMAETAEHAKESVNTLNARISESARSIVENTRDVQKLGNEYDELKKRVKQTHEVQDREKEILDILALKMPDQIDLVQKLTERYGSLGKAIEVVNIQQASLELSKSIDKELEQLKEDRRNILNRAGNEATGFALSAQDERDLANTDAKIKAAVTRRENMAIELTERFKSMKKAQEDALSPPKTTGTSLDFAKTAKDSASKIASAREQLTKLQERLEVELTGLTKGEFEKRRAEAQKNYDDQIRQIKKLGEESKASAKQLSQVQADALAVFHQTTAKIQRDEAVYFESKRRTLAGIGLQLSTLQAEVTAANPFDNIQASLELNIETIKNQYFDAVQKLKEAFNFNVDNPKYKEAIQGLKAVKNTQLQIVKDQAATEKEQAKQAQVEINSQILALEGQLSGKRLEIAEKTNQAIIDDLNAKLIVARVKFGEESNQAGLITKQVLEATQKKDRELADARIANQEDVLASIDREVELRGESQDLLEKHRQALEEMIKLYTQELSLTGLTEEKRSEILRSIQQATVALAQDNTKLSGFGAILSGLSNVHLPTGKYQAYFSSLIGGLKNVNELWTRFKGQDPGGSLFGFLKQTNAKQALGNIGSQVFGNLSDYLTQQKGTFAKLGGVLSGTVSGAIAGAAAGPIGALAGATLGAVSSAYKGGLFTNSNAGVAAAFALSGVFGLFALAKKKANDKIKETQKQLAANTAFADQILNNTDQNSLIALEKSRATLLQQWAKLNAQGKSGKSPLKDAVAKLDQAIKDRTKVIKDEIEALKLENTLLARQVEIIGDLNPITNLDVIRQNQLTQLEADTKKALDAYKDSTEALDLITKNAELRRTQIIAGSAQDIIDAVIEEQNKVRSLRADEAVSAAQASGNQVAIINAELQQRLIALDNDIAAFKGTEEEKTAFLAASAAERTNIVKQAQDQMNDLLQQGLDILNEGLVVSQTKAENQAQRLKKLFGTLNPQGLITDAGNLLQQTVNIGAGAIQFTLTGIQDARALIDQLNGDPVLQARLLAALNTAMAR